MFGSHTVNTLQYLKRPLDIERKKQNLKVSIVVAPY
jgi:hypothetical protein